MSQEKQDCSSPFKSHSMAFSSSYAEALQSAMSFEGMMDSLSVGIFVDLLDYQRLQGVNGNCIEFGVYRGRSASVILRHLGPHDRAILVDWIYTPDLDSLKAINPSFEFIQDKSENLVADPRILHIANQGVRFSHHDASHFYDNLATEMKLLESYIMPRGIMVLDDFCNPCYLQVVSACFHHLAQANCPLEVFLYADNKAYLCRKEDFELYARFLLDDILKWLQEAGLMVYLARTDNHLYYRGFSIARKSSSSMPDRYGTEFFGDQFYKLWWSEQA